MPDDNHEHTKNFSSEPEASSPELNRRQFLTRAGTVGIGAAIAGRTLLSSEGTAQAQNGLPNVTTTVVLGSGKVPLRPFGRTGVNVSLMGLGGHTMGEAKIQAEATRIVHEAIDAGITFMDNAWEYHEGRSEEWLGEALKGRRDKVFLMTKVCTHGRDKKVAMQQLEDSLRRLQTDRLDLWQVHECVYENDPERHFAADNVMEALTEAKKQGKVRFVGFTGHKSPDIHLEMLRLADARGFKFDACQLPVNPFDASFRSFENRVLPELNRRGIAAVGMKSLGGNARAIKDKVLSVREAISYCMSLPVATLVSGIDSLEVLRQNLEIVRGFQAMPAAQMQALRARVAPQAMDGRYELYKSSMDFDGDVGRKQHNFPLKNAAPS